MSCTRRIGFAPHGERISYQEEPSQNGFIRRSYRTVDARCFRYPLPWPGAGTRPRRLTRTSKWGDTTKEFPPRPSVLAQLFLSESWDPERASLSVQDAETSCLA
ncbi:hypothetical protein FOQG_08016 [Fusarium oxysporum f. sp. raphani 54005]|uniref:Uncharacterized protein n=3 Tax=Fusarium oxysporum TaxID=5507 RepID=X0CBY6_FUSOX|nr:hypothetical protein FOVG_05698 [Fusarium oxysporum f. sp. pisi HDV247]EXK88713.1 hypothetical protein FOQG_08016 [Fusarium oxysporum f. sp. raphani 54005]EXL75291.1 hypothetical protein FOPG_09777 [Fusarium oxysporum f. sp. conglutinans race 2 54008]KAI8402851.1 hypothetical protein FOFC_16280 [Fusarium oxysporum]